MGPQSHCLFQHWLPARALPLGARAAFATEMTEVTRKEVAAAVGGMNCSTSVSACSNTSLRRRSSGFKGLQMGRFYFPPRRRGAGAARRLRPGGEMCLREGGCSWGTKRPAPHLPPSSLSFLGGGRVVCFPGREDTKPKRCLRNGSSHLPLSPSAKETELRTTLGEAKGNKSRSPLPQTNKKKKALSLVRARKLVVLNF